MELNLKYRKLQVLGLGFVARSNHNIFAHADFGLQMSWAPTVEKHHMGYVCSKCYFDTLFNNLELE